MAKVRWWWPLHDLRPCWEIQQLLYTQKTHGETLALVNLCVAINRGERESVAVLSGERGGGEEGSRGAAVSLV
jgi:hypothetical protein